MTTVGSAIKVLPIKALQDMASQFEAFCHKNKPTAFRIEHIPFLPLTPDSMTSTSISSLEPKLYVVKLGKLCDEGIAISKDIVESIHNQTEFDATDWHSSTEFNIASIQQQAASDDPRELFEIWSMMLEETRVAAGVVVQSYLMFGQRLSPIFQLEEESAAKLLAEQFERFAAEHGSQMSRFRLDDAPGVKSTLTEIEHILFEESSRIAQALLRTHWDIAVEELGRELPTIVVNLKQIASALKSYETNITQVRP
ncbi:hypothetical protein DFP72DRAFT_85122 [Ephemerocybe angulata]|uniref:Uncharacterized protein n=1 Tax=Ephemerocybe angulata TaxID=980116 RepID=A0A8H6HDP9_9AGAR|nr:hypothetical protein DFP72DRAFT_85122 [Tulosesus angulatus]